MPWIWKHNLESATFGFCLNSICHHYVWMHISAAAVDSRGWKAHQGRDTVMLWYVDDQMTFRCMQVCHPAAKMSASHVHAFICVSCHPAPCTHASCTQTNYCTVHTLVARGAHFGRDVDVAGCCVLWSHTHRRFSYQCTVRADSA